MSPTTFRFPITTHPLTQLSVVEVKYYNEGVCKSDVFYIYLFLSCTGAAYLTCKATEGSLTFFF